MNTIPEPLLAEESTNEEFRSSVFASNRSHDLTSGLGYGYHLTTIKGDVLRSIRPTDLDRNPVIGKYYQDARSLRPNINNFELETLN